MQTLIGYSAIVCSLEQTSRVNIQVQCHEISLSPGLRHHQGSFGECGCSDTLGSNHLHAAFSVCQAFILWSQSLQTFPSSRIEKGAISVVVGLNQCLRHVRISGDASTLYALDGELCILGNSAIIAIINLLSTIQAPMYPSIKMREAESVHRQ